MKKLLKFLCLLLICTAAAGLIEMKVQAEENTADITINDGNTVIYGSDSTVDNLIVNGTMTVSENATVTVTGNLTIGESGKLYIDGTLMAEGEKPDSSDTEGNAEKPDLSDSEENTEEPDSSGSQESPQKLNFVNKGTIYLDGSKGARLLIDSSKYVVSTEAPDTSSQGKYWYVDTSTGLELEDSYIELTYAEELDLNTFFSKHSTYTKGVFESIDTSDWKVSNNLYESTLTYCPAPTDADNNVSYELLSFQVKIKLLRAEITDYSGSILTAVHGQQLKDVKLSAGFAFVNPSASVGAVGDHTFAINYSDGNKAKNYNNKIVTVRVQPSQGDNVASEINGMDISTANLDMNKIHAASQMIARYDALSASEKRQMPGAAVQKLESIRQLVQNQAKCGTNVYWRYSGGTLTIFGQGAMYDYFNKYNSKTLQKNVSGRTYQSCAATADTIVIEDGISRIGKGAFAYFTKVTEVVVNGQNTRCVIGQAAFSCCSKLKKISLKGVSKIEFSGFSKCTSLTKIALPQGLSVLDKSTFLQCKKLKTVSLPATLKTVGSAVFFDCRKLRTITVRGNIKKCGADVFYYANKKCKVFCKTKAANNCKFVRKAAKAGLKIKKK